MEAFVTGFLPLGVKALLGMFMISAARLVMDESPLVTELLAPLLLASTLGSIMFLPSDLAYV